MFICKKLQIFFCLLFRQKKKCTEERKIPFFSSCTYPIEILRTENFTKIFSIFSSHSGYNLHHSRHSPDFFSNAALPQGCRLQFLQE